MSPAYEQVANAADSFAREEQLLLMAHLAERLATAAQDKPRTTGRGGRTQPARRRHPWCGEDAQQWVTRTRRESDQQRGTP